MNRRLFLNKALLTASTIPTMSILSGCGGGGSDSDTNIVATNVASLVSSLQSDKDSSDELHSNSSNNIAVSPTTSNAVARILLAPALASSNSSNFFSSKEPAAENSYLTSNDSANIWEQYASYNNLSYTQFTHQYTKLTASLSLYEYKKSQTEDSTSTQAQSSARSQLSPSLASANNSLYSAIVSLASDMTEDALNYITTLIELAKIYFENSDYSIEKVSYALITYLSIEKLLETVKEKSVSNLDFTTDANIMKSIASMSIAAIALMGVMSIDSLATQAQRAPSLSSSLDDQTISEIESYLRNISLQSSLSMLIMDLMNGYVSSINSDLQALITQLTSVSKDNDITTQEQNIIDSLQDKLATQSTIMALVGVIMKALFAMTSTKAIQDQFNGFNLDSDATNFSALFGSDTLPQDAAFSTYMSELQVLLQNDASFSEIFALIIDMNTRFETATTTDETATMAESEESAFNIASSMSSDAYDFSIHMADLAYNFTMKIEDDAYNFAMQGMEYGYLFASMGEDVGIMADRILWMAVQIGQMADRIGEMADRIVYTETLIVYTEMLILDFGLLIYGSMKMITNMMLSGMAIVFDREWYENDSEDLIVTLIGENMSTMMKNMNNYSLAVIKNQDDLREVTLSALDWVGTNTEA